MKKLIALLVIVIFCVTLTHAIAAVKNPFKFSLSNRLKIRHEDDWRPGQSTTSGYFVGISPKTDARPRYASLEDIIAAKASMKIADIYELSFGAQIQFRGVDIVSNGASSSLNRSVFSASWGNKVTAVKDYLDINVDVGWNVLWDLDPTTEAPGMGDKMTGPGWYKLYLKQDKINYQLPISVGLAGKVKDAGLSWGLAEQANLMFNAEFYKDNDPSANANGSTHAGEPYDVNAGGTPLTNWADNSFGGFFEGVSLTTNASIGFEFFHWFAPQNITCTLKASLKLLVQMPYSWYYELDKEISEDCKVGLEFGLAGPKLYIGARIRNCDNYNTSAPLNGHLGSDWDYGGSICTGYTPVVAGGDKFNSPSHDNPQMRIGPEVSMSVANQWFEFGIYWNGYARDIRRYDEGGTGSTIYWRNDFEVYSTFKL